jgi:outer membrane biosynthesis protein TonB
VTSSARPTASVEGQTRVAVRFERLAALKPHSASVALHAAALTAMVLLAPLAAEDRGQVVTVEIVDQPKQVAKPVEAKRPAEAQQPKADPEPDPKPPRPMLIPDQAPLRRVSRARPYHPRARALNEVDRSRSPAEAKPLFEAPRQAPLFEVPMQSTVGGGEGIEVVAFGQGPGNVFADPRRPGTRGVIGPARDSTRVPAVKLSNSWEITAEPEALNDHELKPVYPPEARARRLEAVVAVELVIDATGRVVRARVVQSAGPTFQRVAGRLPH